MLLLPLGAVFFVLTWAVLKIGHRGAGNIPQGRNLLILSPSGYASVKTRGTEHLESLDNPFFEKIFFLCPGSPAAHDVSISERMKLVDLPYPGWLRWIRKTGLSYTAFIAGRSVFLARLVKFVKARDISVVRSMEPHTTGIMGVFLKRLLGIKHIQDVRANFDLIYLGTGKTVWLPAGAPPRLKRLSRRMEKSLERFVYRNSDLVFGGNKNNMDYAVYCGGALERSAVVRVNIQPDLFDPISGRTSLRRELQMEGKIVLYCGRLSPEKYVSDVLKAFKILSERRKDVHLAIAGDGPQRPELETFFKADGLDLRVRFLGYRDNQFLKRLFVSADAILCPLAGSVLVEAALAELPIVAYDFEWHSEAIVDRYSGMLANFGDIPALAGAVEFLLDHPDEAALYGRRAREIAVSLFLPANIMAREKTLYSTLLP